MIITCPHCNARYKVKDGLIQAKGKKVKCKKCSAVFIAYPHKDAILEWAPDSPDSPVKKAIPPQATPSNSASAMGAQSDPARDAEDANSSQATVKVDRSKLDQYLKNVSQNQEPEEDLGASTVKVDRDQFQNFLKRSQEQQDAPSQATVQVDRSQIDAFIKGADGETPKPPAEGATIKVDRSQIDAVLGKGSPAPETEDSPEPDPEIPHAAAATGDSEGLPDFPDFSDFDGGEAEAAGIEGRPPEPARDDPSPDRLDQRQEGEMPFSFAGSTDEDTSDDTAPSQPESPAAELAGDPADLGEGSSGEPEREEAMFSGQEDLSEKAAPAEKSFTARIDGVEYPSQNLTTLRRWIEEGRLFEEDLVAPDGTDDFKRADEYPEIIPFFIDFFGSQGEAEPEPERPPKKKGFFGWLGRLFK